MGEKVNMKTKSNRFLQLIGCIVMSARDTLISKNNGSLEDYNAALSINNNEDIEDGYYQVTIDAVFTCFATESSGSTPSSWYYAVWLDDDSIAVLTTDDKETVKELDRICDDTWAYLNYEADSFTLEPCTLDISASGLIKDSDLGIMYKQSLEKLGITDDNFRIRYSTLSTKPVDDLLSNVIIGAVIFLIGLVCTIVILSMIMKERKNKLSGFDTSVMPGVDLHQPMAPLVTKSEARKRISNPTIKKSYSKLQRKAILCIVAAIVCITIPGAMLLYNQYYSSYGESVQRRDMLSLDSDTTAKNNDAAELVITKVPSLIYSYNDINYYLVEDSKSFIVILDNEQYSKAEASVKNDGSFKLIGYLEEPSNEIKGKLIDYFEESQGTSISLSDYEETYGKYMLHVQSDYTGSGFPMDKIRSTAIFFGITALFLLYFGIDLVTKKDLVLKKLSYLSDATYAQMEKELEAPGVRKYPQNLYLTENYIVLLHSFSAYKDNSKKENDSLFINYHDITWMYPSNMTQYGKTVNLGITVYNKTFGAVSILSLPTNDFNQNMINEVYNIISQKNPNILLGYNDENQKRIGA